MTDPAAAARSRVVAAVVEPFRDGWRRLDETAWPQVATALLTAAEAHRGLLDALDANDSGATPEAPAETDATPSRGPGRPEPSDEAGGRPASASEQPDGADEEGRAAAAERPDGERADDERADEAARARARRVMAYRNAVARTVLPGLVESLTRITPGQVAGTLLDAAEQRARDACGSLPATVRLPWDDDHLHAVSGDPGALRFNKLLLRALRRLRPRRPRPEVPLRALGWHTLTEDTAYPERRAFAEAQRAWAGALGRIERGWAAWGDAYLRVSDSSVDTEVPEPGSLAAEARALQEALESIAAQVPHADARRRALDSLDAVEASIERELAIAGTLAFWPGAGPLALRRARDPGPSAAWADWCRQATDRLDLVRALLDVLLGCDAVVDRFRSRLRDGYAEALETACRDARERIRSLQRALRGTPASDLEGRIAEIRSDAERAIASVLDTLPAAEAFEQEVRRTGDSMAESLHALTRQVPAALTLHPLPGPDAPPSRPGERRVVRLQEAARQAFDVLRMERIRTQPLSLVERVAPLLDDRDRFEEVVGFGCEAALEELGGGEEASEEQARTLVREGLERAAEALTALPGALDRALDETRNEIAAEVRSGWGRLVERALAQRMQGRYLDARSRVSESLQDLRDRLAPWWHDGSRRIRLVLARVRRSASRMLRRGRTLVGAAEAPDRAAFSTTRALAEPQRLLEGLPLVYQRLFSLAPVSDPGLLAGRDAELADLDVRWRRWGEHERIPIVVVGRPGAGVSSFFNVAVQRLEEAGARPLHESLERRFSDEVELAAHLAERMGLAPVDSLEALAAAVLSAEGHAIPDLVALEGIEHLYLRVPGGTDLIERLLTIAAETAPRVFWLLSVTQSAWQLIQKSEPTAVSQVTALTLAPLGAGALRAAVLTRHRRSGVPLSYVEPTAGRRLLRRRLRRVRGTAGHQKVLEDDFFDRLHRSSGGNVRYALFEWLRAADFSAVEGELRVRPLEPMDFSFLASLDLTQSFTMKALLEHRTLSLDEHDRIFRMPRQESYQIFESLRNRSLIEAPEEEGGDRVGLRSEARWRLVPLLTGAAAGQLAQRNILH